MIDRLDRVVRRAVAGLRHAVVHMTLCGGEHMHVLLCADVHRRDEIVGQLTFMRDDIFGRPINRSLIGLIHIHAERVRGERVHVCAFAERVLAHVSPREVRLDARRGFGDERDRAGRRNRRRLVVARREHVGGDADLVAQELIVRLFIRLVLGEHTFLCAELARLQPRLAPDETHQLVHQRNRLRAAIFDLELQTEISEAHDAKPDRARPLHHVVNLRQRPRAHVNHVIEKMR